MVVVVVAIVPPAGLPPMASTQREGVHGQGHRVKLDGDADDDIRGRGL